MRNPSELYADAVTFFSKHLLAIVVEYQNIQTGQLHEYCCSGTIMKSNAGLIIVTAGHAIRDLKNLAVSNELAITKSILVDTLGSTERGHLPVPFPIQGLKYSFIDINDPHCDIGYILLGPFLGDIVTRGPMQPIDVDDCIFHLGESIDAFILLGFPKSAQPEKHFYGDEILISPIGVPVSRLTLDEMAAYEQRAHQLIGRIPRFPETADIEGMSGGPILAVKQVMDATKYWLTAIQSAWLPQSHIVFGTSAKHLAEAIVEFGIDESKLSVF